MQDRLESLLQAQEGRCGMVGDQVFQAVLDVGQVRHHFQTGQAERGARFEGQQVTNVSAQILNQIVLYHLEVFLGSGWVVSWGCL